MTNLERILFLYTALRTDSLSIYPTIFLVAYAYQPITHMYLIHALITQLYLLTTSRRSLDQRHYDSMNLLYSICMYSYPRILRTQYLPMNVVDNQQVGQDILHCVG